ncbi:uncharacterized protein LOC133836598 [Drosophila sulfurigaster albostrigata]|uniref:uncharacterized protein LOC133836598 n=1 Tax=Drosophila sulfurigaster albostrigata TaxID=89887 RepID=UPI002D21CF61|nr:uncharacterized protein LOC133836598 [Drosophila sulfurigaster albostrigata]
MENQGEKAQESPIVESDDKVVMALYEYERLVRESSEKCFNTIIRLTEERNLLKSMNRMYEEREMRLKKRRLKRQAKKKRAKEFAKKMQAKELAQVKQEVNSTSTTTTIQLGKAEP